MDYYNLDKEKAFLISLKAIVIKDSKILLLKYISKSELEWDNKWGLPGGLLDMDEEIYSCIEREITEETSLKVEVLKNKSFIGDLKFGKFVFKDRRKLNVRIIQIGYICKYKSGEVKLSDEHVDFKWINKEDINNESLSPDSKEILEKYLLDN